MTIVNVVRSGTLGLAASLLLFPGSAQAVTFTDATGDFLSTYTGVQGGDLDVVTAEVSLLGNQLFFSTTVAAPIGTTATAFYVFGLNRGQGTQRFVSGTPSIGAGVFFDSVVILRPDGTGNFNDLINSANSSVLSPANITISGNTISGIFDVSLFPSTGFTLQNYTWNLWPRVSNVAGNAGISDFAPDASNASVVPEPSTLLGLFAALGVLKARKAKKAN